MAFFYTTPKLLFLHFLLLFVLLLLLYFFLYSFSKNPTSVFFAKLFSRFPSISLFLSILLIYYLDLFFCYNIQKINIIIILLYIYISILLIDFFYIYIRHLARLKNTLFLNYIFQINNKRKKEKNKKMMVDLIFFVFSLLYIIAAGQIRRDKKKLYLLC